jgi:tRNA pseudouridine38-40 synthase
MNEAAKALLGEHDFAPFCTQREFASTIRTLQRLDWSRDDVGSAVMTVQADAFCHSMVRALVGVMLPVGEGRRPVTWPGEVLARGDKDSAVTVMPAFPLVLEGVGYPPEEQWAARQRETRSVRTRD